jgi:inner membrane transporter RhtA
VPPPRLPSGTVAIALGGRVPAPLLFVVGGASMYVGAALAVGLFGRLEPAGVAVLRLVGAAAVLVAWRRPPVAAWRGRRLLRSTAFGLATGLMNLAFYEAIARLPLGTAVAVEFCGPVAVAALASRRPRDVAAVGLAAAGVLLIADVRWSAAPSGLAWALAAAAMWAAYIVLGARVAAVGNGVDDMAVGFAAAAVLLLPVLLLGSPVAALAEPRVLVLGLGVGVLSSVVPYVLDQVVLRRVGRARFAVLLALLPATATLVGFVGLGQVPGAAEAAGIAAVVAAVALRSRDGDPPPPAEAGSLTTERDTRLGDVP